MEEYQKLNEETLKKISGGEIQPAEGAEGAEGLKCPLCKSTNLDYYVNSYGFKVYFCLRCHVQWIPEKVS